MENKNFKQILIRYAICLAVATAIVFGVLVISNYWGQTQLSQKYRYLSNGFSVAGILFISFATLFFLSDEGSFVGVGWAMKSALRVILPFMGTKDAETYKSYHDRKTSRNRAKGYFCVFLTGTIYLAVGIVFMILFNSL